MFFETAQKVFLHLSCFCKEIGHQELKKSPNLVTLLTTRARSRHSSLNLNFKFFTFRKFLTFPSNSI